ncbi:MAG TPA: ABC transporter ATP-binding protein [Mesorhizobium sp.]|jgi:multiple sugar transport system ATP-binding protein|nr:ABC transporter ATP-binding protein [Mesorhizobium sp.]
MGSLSLHNIRKNFGATEVLRGIDLEVPDGAFCVFVGPSGCGKSTLLRIIAGLEDASAGAVIIDGARVDAVAPAKRGIAMVFQTYALYPHLTVRDNMALGLKQAGTPASQIEAQIAKATAMLGLESYLKRRPAELSGGQRQRVAIGRALVRDPKLFLFDEPLSNLDAALRVNTRLEIAKLHRELNATMIYVTHDQVEAMTLADTIVVLNAGRIEQAGAPMELYNRPANLFVAGFIGSPKMNFIEGARIGEGAAMVGIRPEHVSVSRERGRWAGAVVHAEHLGADTNLYCDTAEAGLLTVRIFGEFPAHAGDRLWLTPDPAQMHRFGADGRTLSR